MRNADAMTHNEAPLRSDPAHYVQLHGQCWHRQTSHWLAVEYAKLYEVFFYLDLGKEVQVQLFMQRVQQDKSSPGRRHS